MIYWVMLVGEDVPRKFEATMIAYTDNGIVGSTDGAFVFFIPYKSLLFMGSTTGA
jgi:hypothetical protein